MSRPTLDDPRRCEATTSRGTPCMKWRILGGSVCPTHGGRIGRVKAAAKRRLAEAEATRYLADHEVTEVENPVQAFKEIVSESVALKAWFAGRVGHLKALEAAGDQANLRGVISGYERAMDRAAKLLEVWVRLGMDARAKAMEDAEAQILIDVVAATLEFAGVDDERLARAYIHNRMLLLLDDDFKAEGEAIMADHHRQRDEAAQKAADERAAKFEREVQRRVAVELARLGRPPSPADHNHRALPSPQLALPPAPAPPERPEPAPVDPVPPRPRRVVLPGRVSGLPSVAGRR